MSAEMKKRILFVDDEINVLDGLRRMLRTMRHEWDMEFASSARDALGLIGDSRFDLIVSDMRMPEINGVQLLSQVKERCPRTIRIILSGHADSDLTLRAVGVAHQFLSKPCDAETLIGTVVRATELRSLLSNPRLEQLVTQIGALPSFPAIYSQVVEELETISPSVHKVGEIVARDISMSAKVLQIVNSAFFGLPRSITNPVEAVAHLGMEKIQLLVLSIHAFSPFEPKGAGLGLADQLWAHSVATGALARRIAEVEQVNRRMTDEAFAAGILHDIGKLILASTLPDEVERARRLAADLRIPTWHAELEVFGSTHAAVGAYVLGLWGLPDSIVEAVAFHHRPSDFPRSTFGALTAVHVADAIDLGRRGIEYTDEASTVDVACLAKLKLTDRLSIWREVCAQGGM